LEGLAKQGICGIFWQISDKEVAVTTTTVLPATLASTTTSAAISLHRRLAPSLLHKWC